MALEVKETQNAGVTVTWGDRLQDEGQQAEDAEQKCIKTWAPDSIQNHSPLDFFLFTHTFMEE